MDPQQYRSLGKALRKELRRHFLSERERLVAEWILETSLLWGKRSVNVPTLETFTDLTGITRPHVHTALRSLVEMRIVETREAAHGMSYWINANPETWKVKIRTPRASIQRAIERLKALNGMDTPAETDTKTIELPRADSNFKNCSDANFLPGLVSDSETVPVETFWKNI